MHPIKAVVTIQLSDGATHTYTFSIVEAISVDTHLNVSDFNRPLVNPPKHVTITISGHVEEEKDV